MDPPIPTRRRSLKSNSGHNYDNIIASYWKQYRRPATYLDDHDGAVGHRLEPLQLSNQGFRLGNNRNSVAPEEAGTTSPPSSSTPSPMMVPVKVEPLVRSCSHGSNGDIISRKISLPPVPRKDSLPPVPPPKDFVATVPSTASTFKTSSPTDRTAFSFMSSTFAKFNQRRRKNKADTTVTGDSQRQLSQKQKQPQKNSIESRSSFSLPASCSLSGTTDKINPYRESAKTPSCDSQYSTHSFSGSIDQSPASNQTNPAQSSFDQSNNHPSDSNSTGSSGKAHRAGDGTGNHSSGSGSSTGGGSSKIAKKQRPSIPRIVTPDGCSINLSTPPSTPRQGSMSQPSFRPSQMTPWPYNFLQIKELLRTQKSPSSSKVNNRQTGKSAVGKNPRRSSIDQPSQGEQQQQQQQQRQLQQSIDSSLNNVLPQGETQPPPLQQQQQQISSSYDERGQQCLRESGKVIEGTAGAEEAPTPQNTQHERHGYLPEFEIMGPPMNFRTESLSSSFDSKHAWWDYDQDENALGGLCSTAFWQRRFGTRAALANTLKHIASTSLGLLIIIAIALTALGKISHRNLVSDAIPKSLDGTVMEARIVVFKDLAELRRLKAETESSSSGGSFRGGEEDIASEYLRAMKVVEASKIPVWTGPIDRDCFQGECDLEAYGKEFFAFMNPESFGINLTQKNWPSLCNSCIEITRNQFVYTTKVRVLGDLLTCPNDSTDTNGPTLPITTTQPILISISPSLLPTRTRSSLTTTSFKAIASPTPFGSLKKTPKDASRKSMKHRRDVSQSNIPDPRLYQRGPERIKYRPERRQTGPSSPTITTTSSAAVALAAVPTLSIYASVAAEQQTQLPYLIVDATTFENLTRYDTKLALENMDFLRIQFRFVLCDN